jgi:hypothetical protein
VKHVYDHRKHSRLAEAMQDAGGATALSRVALKQLQVMREHGQLAEDTNSKTKYNPDGTVKKVKAENKLAIGEPSDTEQPGTAENWHAEANGDLTQPAACGVSKSAHKSAKGMHAPISPQAIKQYAINTTAYWKARALVAELMLTRMREADPQSEAAQAEEDPDNPRSANTSAPSHYGGHSDGNRTEDEKRTMRAETEQLPMKTSLGGKTKMKVKLVYAIAHNSTEDELLRLLNVPTTTDSTETNVSSAGYTKGFSRGYSKGYSKGYEEGLKAQNGTTIRLGESVRIGEYYKWEPFASDTLTGLSKSALWHAIRHDLIQLKIKPHERATRLQQLLSADADSADYLDAHFDQLEEIMPHHQAFMQGLASAVSGASVHCSAKFACAASQRLLFKLVKDARCDLRCQQLSLGNLAHIVYKEDLSPEMEGLVEKEASDPESALWGVSNLVLGALDEWHAYEAPGSRGLTQTHPDHPQCHGKCWAGQCNPGGDASFSNAQQAS